MKKQRKKGSGGKREGAGRKKIYNEEVVNVTFNCPKSKVQELKELVRSWKKTIHVEPKQ